MLRNIAIVDKYEVWFSNWQTSTTLLFWPSWEGALQCRILHWISSRKLFWPLCQLWSENFLLQVSDIRWLWLSDWRKVELTKHFWGNLLSYGWFRMRRKNLIFGWGRCTFNCWREDVKFRGYFWMKIILCEEKRLLSEKELAILVTTSSAQYLSRVPYFLFSSNGPHYQEIIHRG